MSHARIHYIPFINRDLTFKQLTATGLPDLEKRLLAFELDSTIISMAKLVPYASGNMLPLTGQSNFRQWAQEFQIASQYKGIWRLFTGEEVVLKPDGLGHRIIIANATSDHEAKYLGRRFAAEEEQYRNHLQKIDYAMAFLAESIDPSIREDVQKHHDPESAWIFLTKKYAAPDPSALQKAEKKMETLYQRDSPGLTEYLNLFDAFHRDITKAGGTCTESQSKLKIISGLNPEYVSCQSEGDA